MPVTSPFWAAFYSGMAAPISLFAQPPSYNAYVVPIGPRESLAIAGAFLSNAVGEYDRGKKADG